MIYHLNWDNFEGIDNCFGTSASARAVLGKWKLRAVLGIN